MENPGILSAILSVVGVAAGGTAIKYLWPVIRDSLSAQGGQWRAENRFLKQLQEDLETVKEERDELRKQANELIIRVAKLEAQMQVMTMQMRIAGIKTIGLATDSSGDSHE